MAGTLEQPSLVAVVTPTCESLVTIGILGSVDVKIISVLERHIASALSRRPSCLVIDLAGVTFLGTCGMTLLINTQALAQHQGTALMLRGVRHTAVAAPLRMMDLTDSFTMFD